MFDVLIESDPHLKPRENGAVSLPSPWFFMAWFWCWPSFSRCSSLKRSARPWW